MLVYVIFTFSAKNIFMNAFSETEKEHIPLMFQTSSSQLYTEEYSKGHIEQITEFACAVADWLQR